MLRTFAVVSGLALSCALPGMVRADLLVAPGYAWTAGDYLLARNLELPTAGSDQRYEESPHGWLHSSSSSFTSSGSNAGKGSAKYTNTMSFLQEAGQEANVIAFDGSASGWSHSDSAEFVAQASASSFAHAEFVVSQPVHLHAVGLLQVSGVSEVGPGNAQTMSTLKLARSGQSPLFSLALTRTKDDVASIDLFTLLQPGLYRLDGLANIGTESNAGGGDFSVTSTYNIRLEFSQAPAPSGLALGVISVLASGRRRR